MSLRRRIENSRRLAAVLGWLMGAWFWLCWRTTRWHVEGRDDLRRDAAEGPVLYLLWHSRSALGPAFWPSDVRALTSLHDGSPIGRVGGNVQRFFGLNAVQMSRRKTGNPTREILTAFRRGDAIGMVGDGPAGPARLLNDAALGWARKLDVPVYGMAFATARNTRAKSWDKQLLPSLFTRGAVVYARLDLSSDWSADDTRLALANHLDTVTARADAILGLSPGP